MANNVINVWKLIIKLIESDDFFNEYKNDNNNILFKKHN